MLKATAAKAWLIFGVSKNNKRLGQVLLEALVWVLAMAVLLWAVSYLIEILDHGQRLIEDRKLIRQELVQKGDSDLN